MTSYTSRPLPEIFYRSDRSMGLTYIVVPSMESNALLLSRYRELTGISVQRHDRGRFENLKEYKALVQIIFSLIKDTSTGNALHTPSSGHELPMLAVQYMNIMRPDFDQSQEGFLTEVEDFIRGRDFYAPDKLEMYGNVIKHRLGLIELATRYKNAVGLVFPDCQIFNHAILLRNIRRLRNRLTSSPEVAARANIIWKRYEEIRDLLNGGHDPSKRLFEKPPPDFKGEFYRALDYLSLAFCFHPFQNANETFANIVFQNPQVNNLSEELPMEEIATRIRYLFGIQNEQLALRARQINIEPLDNLFRDLEQAHTEAMRDQETPPQRDPMPFPYKNRGSDLSLLKAYKFSRRERQATTSTRPTQLATNSLLEIEA